jgi:hypothetical protein
VQGHLHLPPPKHLHPHAIWESFNYSSHPSHREGYSRCCVKIAAYKDSWFRFIQAGDDWSLTENDDQPNVLIEHLFSLTMAGSRSKETERELSELAYAGALDAWRVAQESICESWTQLTDPNNLNPEPSLSFRDALDFVNQKGIGLGINCS